MPEAQLVLRRDEHRGRERLVHGGQQGGGGLAQQHRRVFEPERAAEGRGGLQQQPGPGVQPVERVLHPYLDPLRHVCRPQAGPARGDGDRVLLDQASDEIGKQQWVTCGSGGKRRQVCIGSGAERVCEQIGHCRIAERLQADPGRTLPLQQVEEQLRTIIGFRRVPGQDPGQRIRGELAGHRAECVQGSRIGPLQIVQADQQRPDSGALLEPGAERLDEPDRQVCLAVPVRLVGQGGRPFTQGAEQRAHRHEPAQLVGCRRGHREAGFLGRGCRVREQQRLSRPQLPLDEQRAAAALGRASHQLEDCPQFGLPPSDGLAIEVGRAASYLEPRMQRQLCHGRPCLSPRGQPAGVTVIVRHLGTSPARLRRRGVPPFLAVVNRSPDGRHDPAACVKVS